MGFKREAPAVRLDFEHGDLAGLEVVTKPVGTTLVTEAMGKLQRFQDLDEADPENWAAFKAVVDVFRPVLVSWNLEDMAGTPVPCDASGLESQGVSFELALIFKWAEALTTYANQMAEEFAIPDNESDDAPKTPTG